jgi:hypothetical protein
MIFTRLSSYLYSTGTDLAWHGMEWEMEAQCGLVHNPQLNAHNALFIAKWLLTETDEQAWMTRLCRQELTTAATRIIKFAHL